MLFLVFEKCVGHVHCVLRKRYLNIYKTITDFNDMVNNSRCIDVYFKFYFNTVRFAAVNLKDSLKSVIALIGY